MEKYRVEIRILDENNIVKCNSIISSNKSEHISETKQWNFVVNEMINSLKKK